MQAFNGGMQMLAPPPNCAIYKNHKPHSIFPYIRTPRLYLVGLALRANLVASRELRSRVGARLRLDLHHRRARRSHAPTYFGINLCTFAQAVGRFAPLHCLPTPRPYLSPILHTPANQSPALALLYSVLCNLSCHALPCFGHSFCTFAQELRSDLHLCTASASLRLHLPTRRRRTAANASASAPKLRP